MKRLVISILVLVSLLAAACSQAAPAPAPAPTQAPAQPAAAPQPKAAEPTKAAAPAAQPTAVPAPPKVDFPAKGKSITIIVPTAAGGPMDMGARNMATELERQMGWSVNVVNKAGAGQQLGYTDLAQGKPDGYTLGLITIENAIGLYLDTQRKAVFKQDSFMPIAMQTQDPGAVGVKASSPYKSLADLVNAAKANPGKLAIGTIGIMTSPHLAAVKFQQSAGVKMAIVNFDASSEREAALMGGKLEANVGTVSAFATLEKAGELRTIAVLAKQESAEAPGVKTAEAQGHKVYSASTRAFAAPAGTPKEIMDILVDGMAKVMKSASYKELAMKVGQPPMYLGPKEVETFWKETEADTKANMELAKSELK